MSCVAGLPSGGHESGPTLALPVRSAPLNSLRLTIRLPHNIASSPRSAGADEQPPAQAEVLQNQGRVLRRARRRGRCAVIGPRDAAQLRASGLAPRAFEAEEGQQQLPQSRVGAAQTVEACGSLEDCTASGLRPPSVEYDANPARKPRQEVDRRCALARFRARLIGWCARWIEQFVDRIDARFNRT